MRYFILIIALAANVYTVAQKAEEVELYLFDAVLSGTLLVPEEEKNMPVALIIAGSGPTDRNGNNPNYENNSLKFLAESLAQNGIATLRYDKRGVGQSDIGHFLEEELTFEDFVLDAQDWISFLKEDERFSEVVVIGHSEGSLLGIIASQRKNVAKFISIAGPARPANDILLEQIQANSPFFLVAAQNITDSLKSGHLVKSIPPALEVLFRPSVQPYLISWFKYDPRMEISKLKIPVLIVQGSRDIQVRTSEAEKLAEPCESAKHVIIENMNHILKITTEDKTENIKTYSNPDLPIAKELEEVIVDFIKPNR